MSRWPRAVKTGGRDLARARGAGALDPRLSRLRRHLAHDRAHRLCAAALLAAAAGWRPCWRWRCVWLVPPLAALFGHGPRALAAASLAWAAAGGVLSCRRCGGSGRSPLWAPSAAGVAAFYMAATIGSAVEPSSAAAASSGRAAPIRAPGDERRRADRQCRDLVRQGPRTTRIFPVGSRLIARRLRAATCTPSTPSPATPTTSPTSPALAPADKVARLDIMEDVLLGRRATTAPQRAALRASLAETGVTPRTPPTC